ncbi:hypothetical protein [Rubrobacter aplysinae]|uniref:hypothetical protein n=1 Tax=Rubrobacter aplysinae TaxID=909625 RepID=UPI00064BABEA|nr:hypothetical protein [Rubrobacter aplysinae]
MEGYGTWEDLKERIMEAAPGVAEEGGIRAFTENDLARELSMEDAQGKRQLSTAVNQLVDEGRLRSNPGLSKNLSIGTG